MPYGGSDTATVLTLSLRKFNIACLLRLDEIPAAMDLGDHEHSEKLSNRIYHENMMIMIFK